MSRLVEAKRTIALLVVLMAALVALSGPVAEVLDLPAPTAEAKKKKKKKKRNRPPAFNVVQCSGIGACVGTGLNDFMVGSDLAEAIDGQEGNDVYQGNGGDDNLLESSLTSNDFYTGYAGDFGFDEIFEEGGSADFLDLGSLRLVDDVSLVRVNDADNETDDLVADGPGGNNVRIADHFGQGRIETIRFANATVTGTQAQSLAQEATPEEQAEIEEQLEERPSSTGETAKQGEEASS